MDNKKEVVTGMEDMVVEEEAIMVALEVMATAVAEED